MAKSYSTTIKIHNFTLDEKHLYHISQAANFVRRVIRMRVIAMSCTNYESLKSG